MSALIRSKLIDNFGRVHNYLRFSLTEKCNYRCRYCMPEGGVSLTPKAKCLNLDELRRLSNIFVKNCGVDKIRLTGGEPTIDKKLVPFLEHLNDLRESGLKQIAMTTNGFTLKKHCKLYKESGLDVINVSLDTLRPMRFEWIARTKGWNQVFDGIKSAIDMGFEGVKVNCVVLRDFNFDELTDFADLAREHPIEVRFIEFMPFSGNNWSNDQFVPMRDMINVVNERYPRLQRVNHSAVNDTSKIYKDPTMRGSIGYISSMSDNFCGGCNRVRVTADGNLKVCLFDKVETSIRDLMRNGATDREIATCVQKSLTKKAKQHAGLPVSKLGGSRPMVKIDSCNLYTFAMTRENIGLQIPYPSRCFSHLNEKGEVNMVAVDHKKPVHRVARAQGKIFVGESVIGQIRNRTLKKGNIMTMSKVAGILGAKMTNQLIPLCHQIPLDHVDVEIEVCDKDQSLVVRASCSTRYQTGVEMESLVAVTLTLLTIYDMCKSVSKSLKITDVKLISKTKSIA